MHAKLLEVQDVLASNLDWAAAQASQSRARADAENSEGGDTTAAAPEAPQATPDLEAAKAAASARLASNNPFAAVLSGEVPVPGPGSESAKATTEEEDILSEVLSAMSEVSSAPIPLSCSSPNRLAHPTPRTGLGCALELRDPARRSVRARD